MAHETTVRSAPAAMGIALDHEPPGGDVVGVVTCAVVEVAGSARGPRGSAAPEREQRERHHDQTRRERPRRLPHYE